jgi:hypothetical protein
MTAANIMRALNSTAPLGSLLRSVNHQALAAWRKDRNGASDEWALTIS